MVAPKPLVHKNFSKITIPIRSGHDVDTMRERWILSLMVLTLVNCPREQMLFGAGELSAGTEFAHKYAAADLDDARGQVRMVIRMMRLEAGGS
jgi:hypothetical protein